jgi:hypothetical protein
MTLQLQYIGFKLKQNVLTNYLVKNKMLQMVENFSPNPVATSHVDILMCSGEHFLLSDCTEILTEFLFHQASSNEKVCDIKFHKKKFPATLMSE